MYKPLTSILVKPSGPDCNLGCKYCFYLEKSKLYSEQKVHRMNDDVLEELIIQAIDQSENDISIAWQGGEPTLMGLDFFKKVIELEKKHGVGRTIGNGLQTNGYLLNEEWAEFLAEYNWLVGISVDGTEHIHNKHRLTPNGKNTWEVVHRNAEMLLKKGVAVNVLTTLTDYSADYIEEIYHFHKQMGFEFMQFIPIVEKDKNDPTKAADFSLSAEKYGKVLCKLWDLWRDDFVNGKPTTSIRHFENLFFTYVGFEAPECTMQKECGSYTVIEHNGDVYSCDFFVSNKWKLGNIMNKDIVEMLNSPKQEKFGKAKNDLPTKCKRCSYLKHCWGGCPKDRVKDPKDNGLPRFCKSYLMFFAHADKELQEMAKLWHQQQDEIDKQNQAKPYNIMKDFAEFYKNKQ